MDKEPPLIITIVEYARCAAVSLLEAELPLRADINLFREEKGGNPEIVRQSQRARYDRVEDVDDVIALDKAWRVGESHSVAAPRADRCMLAIPALQAWEAAKQSSARSLNSER